MIAKEQETLEIYKNLMEEVKIRIDAVTRMFQKEIIPGPLIQEFCYLQVRMICEIIALACLIAHGTIIPRDDKKIQKQYKPADIMQQLNAISPNFYPHPLTSTRTGPTSIRYDDIKKKFMTKKELLELWSKCGDALHRGDIRKIIAKNIPLQRDFSDLGDSRDKIMNLLGVHRISLLEGKKQFLCVMHEEGTGKIHTRALYEIPGKPGHYRMQSDG